MRQAAAAPVRPTPAPTPRVTTPKLTIPTATPIEPALSVARPRLAAASPERIMPAPAPAPAPARVAVAVLDRGAVPAPASSAPPPPASAPVATLAALPEPTAAGSAAASAAAGRRRPHRSRATTTKRTSDPTLTRFRTAYSQLDARAARDVWPSVDARALERAFQSLKSQELRFDRCSMTVTGARAQAACKGRAIYVPRIGDQSPRFTAREWTFELRKADERWTIASAPLDALERARLTARTRSRARSASRRPSAGPGR